MLFSSVFSLLSSLWTGSSILVGPSPPTGHVDRQLPTERTFLLNVPTTYTHGTPHPLILSFHGAGGNSSKQERITQLSDPALRLNGLPILAAYPQGVNNVDWNMTHIWQGAPYGNATVDDVQFAKDIVLDISANYTIDPRRIYVSGKSNGGGFTSLLSCRPDTALIFAAFAPVSPALYPGTGAFSGCNPGRAVPIIHSHGVEDTDTPFHGRRPGECGFGPEPDVQNYRRRWAIRNGQAEVDGKIEPNVVGHPHVNVTKDEWTLGGAPVVGLTIEGLGHAWPSTLGLDLSGSPNQTATFNFTSSHLIKFFEENPLPEKYVAKVHWV